MALTRRRRLVVVRDLSGAQRGLELIQVGELIHNASPARKGTVLAKKGRETALITSDLRLTALPRHAMALITSGLRLTALPRHETGRVTSQNGSIAVSSHLGGAVRVDHQAVPPTGPQHTLADLRQPEDNQLHRSIPAHPKHPDMR